MENAQSTKEEAFRCPKCKEPGEEMKLTPAPKAARLPTGTKVAEVFCRNARCRWYNTQWLVQINPDGTVPTPKNHSGTPKVYAGFEGHDEQARNLIETLKRNAAAETVPGAEYRGPR